MTGVTPEDVRRRHFGTAPFGHHGYHPGQVDAFCARIADTMSGRDHLTAADIRLVEFDGPPFGHRGYDIDQVDEFLDQICMDLEYLRRGHPLIAPVRQEDPLTHDDVLRVRFSAPPFGLSGYAAEEVGAFLDRLAATLAHDGPSGLTAQDVRATTFHTASPGTAAYHREEVDAFLDLVAHQLAKTTG
ncbi:DivIVA domain-containing protein [Nocardia acidivorans]|uniref:DivIVA domain-containing protein n=1 Tax=Nocardia acidivorans TaxID=404580 RepID=UPI00083413BC|nr:DivIVA domain-containing protein [Nocardia acidivorans]